MSSTLLTKFNSPAQYMIASYWNSAVQQLSRIYLSSVTKNLYPLNNNFPFPFPSSPQHIHFYSSFSFPCPLSYFVIIYFICDFFWSVFFIVLEVVERTGTTYLIFPVNNVTHCNSGACHGPGIQGSSINIY